MYATQATLEAVEARLSAAEDKLDRLITALKEYSTSGAEYPQGSTTHFHAILPGSVVMGGGSRMDKPLFGYDCDGPARGSCGHCGEPASEHACPEVKDG